MQAYLKSIKTELSRTKIPTNEQTEILRDFEELIESAINEGLSEDELINKFGDPKQVVKELEEYKGDLNMESKNFELFKEFEVSELKEIVLKFVSEDIFVNTNDENKIIVNAKNLKHPEDYELTYEDGKLYFVRKPQKEMLGLFLTRKTPDFEILLPKDIEVEVTKINLVSGDINLSNLKTNSFLIKTTSGDARVNQLHTNDINVSLVSGDIEFNEFTTNTADINTVSGDIEFNNTKIDDSLYIKVVSGDVEADNFECNKLEFNSVSGDFDGDTVTINEIAFKSVSGDFNIKNNQNPNVDITREKSLSGKVKIK